MANIIYTKKLKGYKCLTWRGQNVFKHFSRMANHLRQNLGNSYAELFACPHISASALKGYAKANWTSEIFTGKAVPLTSLSQIEQNRYKSLLNNKIRAINSYAQKLLKSNIKDKKDWGELIKLSLKIPGYEHVLVENNKVIVVLWSFENETKEKQSFSISRNLNIEEEIKKDKNVKPPHNEKKEIKRENYKRKVVPKTFEKIETKNVKEVNEIPEKVETKNVKEINEIPEKVETKNVKEINEIPEKVETKNVKEINEIPEKVETKNVNEINEIPEIIEIKNYDNQNSTWFKRNLKLLLIAFFVLLLIIICIIFCRPNEKVLPDIPGVIVPIDTTKIINDPDSVRSIVADRLNIALSGDNKNMKDFAKRFKEEYPDKNYKIIYYDTLTYRLQIEVPKAERVKIKSDLPKKIPEFKMMIWHEGIFKRNYKPSDPGFSNNRQSWYHGMVKVFEAWDISAGDSDVIIAIIDDGFDLKHPEFAGKIYKPRNVPGNSANVNTGKKSIHGTHVAGISLGLADNGHGVSGIAPKCKFMPIQVGDYNGLMSTTTVIDGVLYAINNGANVVNMSLGMAVDPRIAGLPLNEQEAYINHLFKGEEDFWNQLFEMAYEKNVIFVLAAGNQNVMIGLDPMQRSNKTIKVSAIDPSEKKANFSNFGNKSTISAPGVQIYSSVPNNKFTYLDGTSMAAPIVTGGIALIKTINPALSYDEIVDLIQSTGIPVNSANRYVGNIIQLNLATRIANNNRKKQPIVDCPDMQHKIDSLLQEIEKIRKQCPDSSETEADTLKIPPKAKDVNFAVGRWKSTTYLYNNSGEKITVYFDFFANGKGKIILVEPNNTQCSASLNLSFRSGKLIINQLNDAACNPPPKEYSKYYFECEPDKTGCAECLAENKIDNSNKFKFKLVKLNN